MSDGVVVRRAVTSGPAKVTGGAMTSGIHRTILQKSQGFQGRVPLTGKSGKSVLCADIPPRSQRLVYQISFSAHTLISIVVVSPLTHP